MLQSYFSKLCGFTKNVIELTKKEWGRWERECKKDPFTPLKICESSLDFASVSWERHTQRFHFITAENAIPSWRATVLQNSFWQHFGSIKSRLQTAKQHWFDTCHGCFVNTLDFSSPSIRLLLPPVTLLLLWQILQNTLSGRSSEKHFQGFMWEEEYYID